MEDGRAGVQYRERIVFIGQFIDDEFGNQLVATMLYLDSIDSGKPLNLYINSPGGEVSGQRHLCHCWLPLSLPSLPLSLHPRRMFSRFPSIR